MVVYENSQILMVFSDLILHETVKKVLNNSDINVVNVCFLFKLINMFGKCP
jgi:hypothetical protein